MMRQKENKSNNKKNRKQPKNLITNNLVLKLYQVTLKLKKQNPFHNKHNKISYKKRANKKITK